MSDCIFCKIVDGKIPAYKVYEDEDYLAFLDIAPVNPGHTLVIPKKHSPTLLEMPQDDLSGYLAVVRKVAKGVVLAMEIEGFNLGLNNGAVAGQIVPHVHFHVMPRHPEDGLRLWPQKKYLKDEGEEIAGKIRGAIG